jgi:hypothetical protein
MSAAAGLRLCSACWARPQEALLVPTSFGGIVSIRASPGIVGTSAGRGPAGLPDRLRLGLSWELTGSLDALTQEQSFRLRFALVYGRCALQLRRGLVPHLEEPVLGLLVPQTLAGRLNACLPAMIVGYCTLFLASRRGTLYDWQLGAGAGLIKPCLRLMPAPAANYQSAPLLSSCSRAYNGAAVQVSDNTDESWFKQLDTLGTMNWRQDRSMLNRFRLVLDRSLSVRVRLPFLPSLLTPL